MLTMMWVEVDNVIDVGPGKLAADEMFAMSTDKITSLIEGQGGKTTTPTFYLFILSKALPRLEES